MTAPKTAEEWADEAAKASPSLSDDAKLARAPQPPEELVGALHDRVHREAGTARAAKRARVAELEGEIRRAKREAWDEGYAAGWDDGFWKTAVGSNPYELFDEENPGVRGPK